MSYVSCVFSEPLSIEAKAALAYWSAWSTLPIQYPRADLSRVPEHWQIFGARVSALTGSPRLAVNPPNAVLNYLYSVLEAEAHLAAAELGLDPGLGMLHRDTPNRDSLACDLMEPIRPLVDAYLVCDLILLCTASPGVNHSKSRSPISTGIVSVPAWQAS